MIKLSSTWWYFNSLLKIVMDDEQMSTENLLQFTVFTVHVLHFYLHRIINAYRNFVYLISKSADFCCWKNETIDFATDIGSITKRIHTIIYNWILFIYNFWFIFFTDSFTQKKNFLIVTVFHIKHNEMGSNKLNIFFLSQIQII